MLPIAPQAQRIGDPVQGAGRGRSTDGPEPAHQSTNHGHWSKRGADEIEIIVVPDLSIWSPFPGTRHHSAASDHLGKDVGVNALPFLGWIGEMHVTG